MFLFSPAGFKPDCMSPVVVGADSLVLTNSSVIESGEKLKSFNIPASAGTHAQQFPENASYSVNNDCGLSSGDSSPHYLSAHNCFLSKTTRRARRFRFCKQMRRFLMSRGSEFKSSILRYVAQLVFFFFYQTMDKMLNDSQKATFL